MSLYRLVLTHNLGNVMEPEGLVSDRVQRYVCLFSTTIVGAELHVS